MAPKGWLASKRVSIPGSLPPHLSSQLYLRQRSLEHSCCWKCWLLTPTRDSASRASQHSYLRKAEGDPAWTTKWLRQTKRRDTDISLPLNTWVKRPALRRWPLSSSLRLWRLLLQLFTAYFAALMAFPSGPSFWGLSFSYPAVFLHKGVCALFSSSLYLDIGILFHTGKATTNDMIAIFYQRLSKTNDLMNFFF